jgi:hypothetical protein
MILRAFSSCDVHLLFRAFTVYARPILEYCPEIWNPGDVANVNLIEKVQRNFTKRAFARTGNSTISYDDRLRALNTNTLEFRRGISDLSVVYKLVNGLITLDSTEFFSTLNGRYATRGHNRRLTPAHVMNKRPLSQFLSNRVVPIWNNLPEPVVNVKSLDSFKSQLYNLPTKDIIPFSRLR